VTKEETPKYIGETEKNLARLREGELDEWITTTEAANLSGFHIEHIRRLIRNGHVDARKWGREWMVDRNSLVAYLDMERKPGPKSAR
jgi:excisionase family DNA binding protein